MIMMKLTSLLALTSGLGVGAYNSASPESSRRNMLKTAAASATMLVAGMAGEPRVAQAADDIATPLYFGVGCFWHIQVRAKAFAWEIRIISRRLCCLLLSLRIFFVHFLFFV